MSVSAKRITPPPTIGRGNRQTGSTATVTKAGETNVVPLPVRALTGLDDRQLLAKLAGGEAAAFSEMMRRHLSAVLATARRVVRDEAEAEDIAQETFLRLWDQADKLVAGDFGLRPWLRRVSSNLAIDRLRTAKRYEVKDDLPEQAVAATQLKRLDEADQSTRVDQALGALPQRQRLAISLFHFDELSQRDIAAMMSVSEEALESLLARGRRRLRELLKDDWQELLINDQGET